MKPLRLSLCLTGRPYRLLPIFLPPQFLHVPCSRKSATAGSPSLAAPTPHLCQDAISQRHARLLTSHPLAFLHKPCVWLPRCTRSDSCHALTEQVRQFSYLRNGARKCTRGRLFWRTLAASTETWKRPVSCRASVNGPVRLHLVIQTRDKWILPPVRFFSSRWLPLINVSTCATPFRLPDALSLARLQL